MTRTDCTTTRPSVPGPSPCTRARRRPRQRHGPPHHDSFIHLASRAPLDPRRRRLHDVHVPPRVSVRASLASSPPSAPPHRRLSAVRFVLPEIRPHPPAPPTSSSPPPLPSRPLSLINPPTPAPPQPQATSTNPLPFPSLSSLLTVATMDGGGDLTAPGCCTAAASCAAVWVPQSLVDSV